MKIATCNEPWKGVAIEEVFATAKGLGYDGVELAPFTLAEDVRKIDAARRKAIRKAAGDCGVEIVGLHWLFVSPPGLHLTTPDVSVRAEAKVYLEALGEFCAELGGKVMIFGSPRQRNIEPPVTPEEAWKRAAEVFAGCADRLQSCGVTLGIEALSPKETNFIQTAEQAAKLADEVNHPAIGIMLDVKAIASMPGGPVEQVKRFGARAVHFHVNQPSGKGAGMPLSEGDAPDVDLPAIMAALKSSGYAGWVSLEPFDYTPDPTTVARVGLAATRAAMGK